MSLIVQLKHFMCWDDYTLELGPGVTLLKGPSGVGKSTIFKAISWCLYGRIRKVNPKKNEHAKTSVTLVVDGITITRKKKPNLFKVVTEKEEYEDQLAQDYINKRYGLYDVWWSGCYATQRLFNHFLESAVKEKTEIINQLAFNDIDPTTYIKRIETTLSNEEKILKQAEYDYMLKKEIFQSKYKDVEDKNMTKEQLLLEEQELTQQLKEEKEHYNHIKQEKEKYDKHCLLLETTKQSIQKHTININVIHQKQKENDNNLSDYNMFTNKTESELVSMQHQHLRVIELQQKLASYKEYSNIKVTQKDYEETIVREAQVNEMKKKCKAFNIPYDKTINQRKVELQNIIQWREWMEQNNKIEKLQSQIKSCQIKELPTVPMPNDTIKEWETQYESSQKQLNTIEYDLKQAILQSKLLECPSCGVALLYKPHCLEVSKKNNNKTSISDLEKEKRALENKIKTLRVNIDNAKGDYEKQLKTYHQSLKEIQSHNATVEYKRQQFDFELVELLKTKMEKPKKEYKDKRILDQLYKDYKNIESIQYIEEPKWNSTMIMKSLEYQKLQTELDGLETVDDSFLENYTHYKKLIQEQSKLRQELKPVENMLHQLQQDQDRIQKTMIDKEFPIEELELNIKEIKNKIETTQIYQHMIKDYELVKEKEEIYETNKNKVERFQKLLHMAKTTENELLEKIVTILNAQISDVCKTMFTEDIVVDIQLYKDLKSGEKKNTVETHIYHRGDHYEDPSELSIGEQDRLSLAFIFAFSTFSNFPCIILDECLNSVQEELKMKVFESIKQFVPNKMVVCALHDSCEGDFDTIIDI